MRRVTRWTLWVGITGALLLGAPDPGSAQQKSANPNAQYDALIDSALQEYRLGHWTEAKAFFAQAHELQPNARTLRGLGLVCYELRRYVEAIGHFRAALASTARPLTDPMRQGVTQLMRDAERFVSRVDLQLTPSDAALTIDGHPVAREPDSTFLVDAGTHELSAEATGYESATRTVSTDGGETIRVNLALRSTQPSVAEAAIAPSPTAQPQLTAAEPEPTGEIAPWIVIGASGAVMIAGGVLLGVALADKSEIEGARQGEHYWSEVEGAYERVPVFSAVGGIMLGLGTAGLAAGVAWKLWPEEAQPIALQPLPGGMLVRGAF